MLWLKFAFVVAMGLTYRASKKRFLFA